MATNLNVTRRIDIRATASGFTEVTGAMKSLSGAHDQLAQASAGIATVTEQSSRKMLSMQNALDRQEQRLSATARAYAQLENAQRLASQAGGQSASLQEQANRVLVMAAQRYQEVAVAADRAALAQKKSAQDMVSRQTITPDRGADIAAVSKNINDLRSRYLPLVNVQRAYREELEQLRSPLARTAMSERERTEAIQRTKDAFAQQVVNMNTARASTDKYAGASGLARHELINFSRQVQDVGVSLASGQSPFMVLVQQGTQIADIFASSEGSVKGLFGQIASGAAKIFTPVRLAVGGIAAIGTTGIVAAMQFSSAQQDVERSLVGVGRASGVTRQDINRIASDSASAFGLSRSEAREFASTLAATGRIGVSEIGEIVAIGKDVARVYGVDAADAAKMLAAAYTDPAKGAEELNKRLGAFDAGTMRNIQSLQNQNRIMEAQQLITAGIKSGVEGINATISTSTNFWTALGNTVSDFWDKFGEGASRMTGIGLKLGLQEQIQNAEQSLQGLQKRFSEMSPRVQSGPAGNRIFNQMKAEQEELVRLQAEWEKYGVSMEQAKARRESVFQRKQVFDALPELGQIETLNDRYRALEIIAREVANASEAHAASLARGGVNAATVAQAMAVTKEQIVQATESLERRSRMAGVNEGLRDKYSAEAGVPISTDFARQAAAMDSQLAGAVARTREERLLAAEAQAYTNATLQGASAGEAALMAAKARAATEQQLNASHKDTMLAMEGQLQMATAVSGAEKIAAAGAVEFANAINQGATAQQASERAAMTMAIAYQQIQSQAKATLFSMQQQERVSAAIGGHAKIRAQEQATYNNLVFQGVDAQLASSIAAQERSNAEAQASASIYESIQGLEDQTRLIYARANGTEGSVRAEIAYEQAMRASGDTAAASAMKTAVLANERAKAYERAAAAANAEADALNAARAAARAVSTILGGMFSTAAMYNGSRVSDFGTGAPIYVDYRGFTHGPSNSQMAGQGGSSIFKGGYDFAGWGTPLDLNQAVPGGSFGGGITYIGNRGMANAQGLEALASEMLEQNKSTTEIVSKILKSGVGGDQVGIVSRLTGLLPEDQQANEIEKVLREVQRQPVTLAREELIIQLTEKIKQLKESTDALNNTIGLDPLYTQGHGYVGIGYYNEGGRSPRIPIAPDTEPGTALPATTTPAPSIPQLAPPGIAQLQRSHIPYLDAYGRPVIGLAAGGSFMVDGMPGQDTNYVPLGMTRGELIDVTPAHEAQKTSRGGTEITNNVTNIFNFPPDRSYGQRKTQRHAREGFGRAAAAY